ncbi:MAG: serpin family protein [Gemmatimonadaceae bacterium]
MSLRSARRPSGITRRALPAASAVLALLAAACSNEPTSPGPRESTPVLTELPRQLTAAERATVAAGNDFSLALFRTVNAATPVDENVAISPFSASVALGMTMNGADGETYDAMRSTLGLDGQTEQEINTAYRDLWKLLAGLDPSVTITSANAIFHRQELTVAQPFARLSHDYFDATVRGLDFADQQSSLAAINGWASEKTSGRIPEVLRSIERDQVMFLMNALYFKGEWRSRFDAARTQPGPFLGADGTPRTVPLMRAPGMPLMIGGDATAEVGELPYGNGAYAMTIVLPRPDEPVDEFVADLTPERWTALLGTLHDATREVVLPRFTLEYSGTWNDVLTDMGMGIAFDDRADFGRLLDPAAALHIDFVKQDVFLAVDEVGTEAAAVTTVGIGVVSAPGPFVVNRPFVLAIRERLTGTILFIGTVRRLG